MQTWWYFRLSLQVLLDRLPIGKYALKNEAFKQQRSIGFNTTFRLDSLEDLSFFWVQIARFRRAWENQTQPRGRSGTARAHRPQRRAGKAVCLPFLFLLQKKKTHIFQIQLNEQTHAPKHWGRSYFSLAQCSLSWLDPKGRHFHEPAGKEDVVQ